MYDDASRPALEGELDTRLKYDSSGPVRIILVPQPSDDPNDPLVSLPKFTIHGDALNKNIELAAMEARLNHSHPRHNLRHSVDSQPSPRCKHRDPIPAVQ